MRLTHSPQAPAPAGTEHRAQQQGHPRAGRPGRKARGVPAWAVVTDQAVPEGHKGLHGFLYGENGAEVHEQRSEYYFRQVSLQEGLTNRACSTPVPAICRPAQGYGLRAARPRAGPG